MPYEEMLMLMLEDYDNLHPVAQSRLDSYLDGLSLSEFDDVLRKLNTVSYELEARRYMNFREADCFVDVDELFAVA